MEKHITDHLTFLRSQQRFGTARSVERVLTVYESFLVSRQKTPVDATTDDLHAYQQFLATPAACNVVGCLAITTQSTHLSVVRSFHRWLVRRGHAITNPSSSLVIPKLPKRTVAKEDLSQQEAQALLETAGAEVDSSERGSKDWAIALRDLALVGLGIASGLRRSGLCDMLLTDIDAERNEIRVEEQKGRAGRVLPVAEWSMKFMVAYRDQARSRLLGERTSDFLFVGTHAPKIGHETFANLLPRLQQATVTANPDLSALAEKSITPHSLRVTCARLLFANGCPIRSVNEILLHHKLSTTALYTPVTVEALRQELVSKHPRC